MSDDLTFAPHVRRKGIYLLVGCAFLVGVAPSQTAQPKPEKAAYAADSANVADAITKVRSGEFGLVHVDIIAQAGATEAIPTLKEQFMRVQDEQTKAKLASALVRLGDRDETYWDYVAKFATPAIEGDSPSFMSYDSQGKALPGPSDAFLAWAKAHNFPSDSAGSDSVYMYPARVIILGETDDPRAIPLLRRALLSPNYQIEIAAATVLASNKEKESIPLIIAACGRAPAEVASAMAMMSLLFFDDPRAQSAAERYVPVEQLKAMRAGASLAGKDPLNLRP